MILWPRMGARHGLDYKNAKYSYQALWRLKPVSYVLGFCFSHFGLFLFLFLFGTKFCISQDKVGYSVANKWINKIEASEM